MCFRYKYFDYNLKDGLSNVQNSFNIMHESRKENHRCPAVKLYSKSPTFRLAYTYARMIADKIYILSAKHGLVSADTIIEPYNETLNGEPKEKKQAWSKLVLSQLEKSVPLGQDEFIFLAGKGRQITLAFQYIQQVLKECQRLIFKIDNLMAPEWNNLYGNRIIPYQLPLRGARRNR